jgi:dihydroorotate dehydrogenase
MPKRSREGIMPADAYALVRPLLFALDPERAHELTLKSLQAGLYLRGAASDDRRLTVEAIGLR